MVKRKYARKSGGAGGPRVARNHVYACTHDLGYRRQDVFACLTCMKKDRGGKYLLSGFCASCKLSCHADHAQNVVELYAKRNFKCDCGNDRMKNSCRLCKKERTINVDNVYSHNFVGKYCRCDKMYSAGLGNMYQCVACEDWYHSNCIRMPTQATKKKMDSTMFEFVCSECMQDLPFLKSYYIRFGQFKPKKVKGTPVLSPKARRSQCVRPQIDISGMPVDCDYFWKGGFRKELCRCADCRTMYREYNAMYLIDTNELLNLGELPMAEVDEQEEGGSKYVTRSLAGRKRKKISGSNEVLEEGQEWLDEDAKWTAAELEMRDFLMDSAIKSSISAASIRKFMVGIKGLLSDLAKG